MPSKCKHEERARAMLRQKLAEHSDEGVQAINAAFDVPESSVKRVAAALRAKEQADG